MFPKTNLPPELCNINILTYRRYKILQTFRTTFWQITITLDAFKKMQEQFKGVRQREFFCSSSISSRFRVNYTNFIDDWKIHGYSTRLFLKSLNELAPLRKYRNYNCDYFPQLSGSSNCSRRCCNVILKHKRSVVSWNSSRRLLLIVTFFLLEKLRPWLGVGPLAEHVGENREITQQINLFNSPVALKASAWNIS